MPIPIPLISISPLYCISLYNNNALYVCTFCLVFANAVEPLEFECSSQLNDASVVISCTANKECDLDCYLDETPHLPCKTLKLVSI